MSAQIEAGNILRGFVSDAGDRIGVMQKFLNAVGRADGGTFLEKPRRLRVRRRGFAGSELADFEDLAFDNPSDAIKVGAAIALDVAWIFRGAAKPEDKSDQCQDGNAGQRKPLVPVFQNFFQPLPLRPARKL